MSASAMLEQTRHLSHRPVEQWGQFQVHYRDLRPLKLNIETPFVPFLLKSEWTPTTNEDWDELIQELIDYSRTKATSCPTIFTTDYQFPAVTAETPLLRQHSIAIFDRAVVSSFSSAREWSQKWLIVGRALARCVGLSALHPYVPGEPASGGRFFGRSKFIDQIVSGRTIRNCTIVG